jgi:hypothetical protein
MQQTRSLPPSTIALWLALTMLSGIPVSRANDAGFTTTPRGQDLYTECKKRAGGLITIGVIVGRLDGHALIQADPLSPVLCVAPGLPAPDGAGKDGVSCVYQAIGNLDAWGGRRQDGSVQIDVDGKVPTAGWHHLAMVRHPLATDRHDLSYDFVGCRPFWFGAAGGQQGAYDAHYP